MDTVCDLSPSEATRSVYDVLKEPLKRTLREHLLSDADQLLRLAQVSGSLTHRLLVFGHVRQAED
jgi:hypothetical protein